MTALPTGPPPARSTTSRRGLLLGLTLGLPVLTYGVGGALVDADRTHPVELATWLAGTALVNDLVLIPTALAVGWTARRLTPVRLWPGVRAGLLTTGVLGLVAWPFVRGYGRNPADPSLLPRDYGAGLLLAVLVVWLTVGVAVGAGALTSRRRPPAGPPGSAAPGEPPADPPR